LNEICVPSVELPEGYVILDVSDGSYVLLDAAASLIWASVRSGIAEDAIGGRLARANAIDPPVAAADVARFLGECRARGFVGRPARTNPPRTSRRRNWLTIRAWSALLKTAFRLRHSHFAAVAPPRRCPTAGYAKGH